LDGSVSHLQHGATRGSATHDPEVIGEFEARRRKNNISAQESRARVKAGPIKGAAFKEKNAAWGKTTRAMKKAEKAQQHENFNFDIGNPLDPGLLRMASDLDDGATASTPRRNELGREHST
jgi:hypothetical protein